MIFVWVESLGEKVESSLSKIPARVSGRLSTNTIFYFHMNISSNRNPNQSWNFLNETILCGQKFELFKDFWQITTSNQWSCQDFLADPKVMIHPRKWIWRILSRDMCLCPCSAQAWYLPFSLLYRLDMDAIGSLSSPLLWAPLCGANKLDTNGEWWHSIWYEKLTRVHSFCRSTSGRHSRESPGGEEQTL